MRGRSRFLPLLALALALALGLTPAACTNEPESDDAPATEGTAKDAEPAVVRFGTLPTEDALPLWVAESEGLFEEAGLDVEIVVFPSAQERDAALTAGAIDAHMGDIIAASLLENAGIPVSIATVMLGATSEEGRFGVVAAPGSEATSLEDLAGEPIGTSSNTIQEYVLDALAEEEGLAEDQLVKEEVDKVPVRFDLLMNGQLAAAALPEPLLSLAEFQGATIVAEDSSGENVSQTVLVVSDAYVEEAGGAEATGRLLEVWDEAVVIVNGDPDAWRETLVESARLPEPIKDTYAVNTYPSHQLPTEEQVAAVLEWMDAKGLLETEFGYADLVWEPGS